MVLEKIPEISSTAWQPNLPNQQKYIFIWVFMLVKIYDFAIAIYNINLQQCGVTPSDEIIHVQCSPGHNMFG